MLTIFAQRVAQMKEFICYWVLQISCGSVRFVLHHILSFKFGGKGKVVSPVTHPLLLKSATQLARDIRERKVKSEEAVRVYLDRILEVEPYINATAERCFENALEKAKEVDSLIASESHSTEFLLKEKPLLGVPFSVKLQLMVKGLPCTAGFKPFKNLIAVDDAPAVRLMKEAGAIVITSTNIPEFVADIETVSSLYGRTRNPYNTNRTCGGTSGGEAALIAAGGSVLGLGTDSLGSVRIPATFTGIFSHKPTRDLVPDGGFFPSQRPDEIPRISRSQFREILTAGPMCRYAEDLQTSMKILSAKSGREANFHKQVDFGNVKVYYLKEVRSPGVPTVCKEIKNAIKEAASYFENHYSTTVEEVDMPVLYDANRCMLSVLNGYIDNAKEAFLSGVELGFNEKLDFLKFFFGKSVLRFTTLAIFNLSGIAKWYLNGKAHYYEKMLEEWRTEFHKLLDDDSVLLMPTTPVISPYHFEGFHLYPAIFYTGILSILGLPSTQCPVGFTKDSLPYGIQIVGRENNDALTIAFAVELEKTFGGWKSPGKQ